MPLHTTNDPGKRAWHIAEANDRKRYQEVPTYFKDCDRQVDIDYNQALRELAEKER